MSRPSSASFLFLYEWKLILLPLYWILLWIIFIVFCLWFTDRIYLRCFYCCMTHQVVSNIVTVYVLDHHFIGSHTHTLKEAHIHSETHIYIHKLHLDTCTYT